MQLLSKFDKGICFLLYAIDIYSKYAWVIPLKDKKVLPILMLFKNIRESGRKPNKMLVDKFCSEFYNRWMKLWLEKNDIGMYSAHNKGLIIVAERFIKTSKNKIYKCMTLVSKNVYINKLDDMVNKCNNIYHSTIKMKPVDVKSSTYTDFEEKSDKDGP